MDKLSINLLPNEILAEEKSKLRDNNLVRFSVILLAIFFSITTLIFIGRLIQAKQLSSAEQNLTASKNKVSALKTQEGLVVFLKQRLDTISSLESQDSAQVGAYNLMTALIPPEVTVTAFSLDKNSSIILSVDAPDVNSLRIFFDNLVNPITSQGKITKIKIDSLSRTATGAFHSDMTIATVL